MAAARLRAHLREARPLQRRGESMILGRQLGGPDPDHRTVLAMATSSRHPGIAMAIAQISFPNEKALAAVVLLFLLVNALVSIPTSRGASAPAPPPTSPSSRPQSPGREPRPWASCRRR
jgi:hypothetical protein